MPLDTTPLSGKRKLLALGVLVAFFGASLGLAQFIVSTHKGGKHWSLADIPHPVRYLVVVPEDFKEKRSDYKGDPDIWEREGAAGFRRIERIDFPFFIDPKFKSQNGPDIVRHDIQEELRTRHFIPRLARKMQFGGVEAELFIGVDAKSKSRAFAVTTGFRDHYIALIYSGDNEPMVSASGLMTDEDEKIFLEICRKSRVIVEGVELAPSTQNAATLR
jgi:hypothetical protein